MQGPCKGAEKSCTWRTLGVKDYQTCMFFVSLDVVFCDFGAYAGIVKIELSPESRRVGQVKEFGNFRCVFQAPPRKLPKGIPEEPFCELGVEECPKVRSNGYQNPKKCSQSGLWYPRRFPLAQDLPLGWARALQKTRKVFRNRRFLSLSGSFSCLFESHVRFRCGG